MNNKIKIIIRKDPLLLMETLFKNKFQNLFNSFKEVSALQVGTRIIQLVCRRVRRTVGKALIYIYKRKVSTLSLQVGMLLDVIRN